MASRKEDRRDDRHDAGDAYGDTHGAAYDHAHGDTHGDGHRDMHGDAHVDTYDGMDALMAAIMDEPLPEGALDDAAFAAEHRSALADVALLREQLGLIGDALAADRPAVNGTETEAVTPAGRPAAARPAPGTEGTPRPAQTAAPETEPAPAPTPPVKSRTAAAPSTRPTRTRPARTRPARPRPARPRPARTRLARLRPARTGPARTRTPRRRPRALALAFGTLAAAVAFFTVVGLGWLIAQSGGVDSNTSADSSSDKSASRADAGEQNSSASPTDLMDVACARLIAEGTVTGLEPVPGTGQSRVTLDVERSYKPEKSAKGDDELVFPVDESEASRLGEGKSVLVGIHRDEATPYLLVTGEKNIARERALVTEELTAARGLKCEDGG